MEVPFVQVIDLQIAQNANHEEGDEEDEREAAEAYFARVFNE